jgi:tetratricopeptide (TPR) repeat protein
MAVGLGVITAVLTLLFWRLVRRSDVTFQHTVLKAGGRRTRAGTWALAGVGLWLLFTLHTAGTRWWKHELVQTMGAMPVQADAARLEAALGDAAFVRAWSLFDDPTVVALQGLLYRRLGRHVEAEAALQQAYAQQGFLQYVEANLCLAAYCMDPARRQYEQAGKLVDDVLQHHPQHREALRMKAFLEQVPK